MAKPNDADRDFGLSDCSLSREQVAAILAKLAEAEAIADKRDAECVENDHLAAARYFRGQGNGLFRAAFLIREAMDEG